MNVKYPFPIPATVAVDSWAGIVRIRCEVLGECRRKGKPHYRVRMLENVFRFSVGQVRFPPVFAVKVDTAVKEDARK